ncbi:MAG: ABC transporter permease [Ardenticatenaceae bacterium]|nr:ABC transporter permease [Ardenticatenaceae bacterium]
MTTQQEITSVNLIKPNISHPVDVESYGIISPAEIMRIAWEGVARNKVRSLLTMLGVIIGVGAVIIMIAISAGTEATISEQIEGLGSNLVFIQAGFGRGGPGGNNNDPTLIYDDVELVAGVNGVVGTAVEQQTTQTIKSDSTTLTDVPLVGTTPDFPSVRDVDISQGRFFNETELERKSKLAILSHGIAQELFGDENPIGQSITVGTTKLTVIGVAAERGIVGNTDFDSLVYAPITLVFDRFLPAQFARFAGDRVRIIYAEIEEEADMENVITQIQLRLAGTKDVAVEELPFTIQTQNDIIETEGATTEAFRNLLAWVAGVSLLVGGIGIMNIMLVSVTERTREIGIRQSVGATPNDIRLQFLTEAILLSLVGGLIGIAVGVIGGILFGQTSDMRTVIVPESIFLAFGSAAAVGIFFGFFPANKAAQLDPIEALRYE